MPTKNHDARYNISRWSEGYFQINAEGCVEVLKEGSEKGVTLESIVHTASNAGLHLPLLIRFTHILHDRVHKLYQAFEEAIVEVGYKGAYQLVYPIKVNQESSVVRALLTAPHHAVGLEAGSKPELMAAIGLLAAKKATIICNGYKDASYIRTALIAQKMGHSVFIVIEKQSELDIILRESSRLSIKPRIGIRIRLVTTGAGKWEHTGGAKSKFGLNAEQVLALIQALKQQDALDCFELMHCHLGSQIANIEDIRNCILEVARYYIELRRLNAPIKTIDVGGGLAVDYEGTHSNTDCSMNYSLQEYATHILLAIHQLCDTSNMPDPDIISESGRALTAHHAVLITNITDLDQVKTASSLPMVTPNDHPVIQDIWGSYQAMKESTPSEIYHFAAHSLSEAHALFKDGVIDLHEKAKVEQIYTAICLRIQTQLHEKNPSDKPLIEMINTRLATKIFCNLSFFQSIPDAWAIGQLFPVLPIAQLNNPLTMQSILQDLTCDSDGTIKEYTGTSCIKNTLQLPVYDETNPYAMAFFMVGAYQEILGNLHNLFGDTNSLDVKLTDEGQFEINELVRGDTVENVLNYAHFDTKKLLLSYEKQLIGAQLPRDMIMLYLNELRSNFAQLTYLSDFN